VKKKVIVKKEVVKQADKPKPDKTKQTADGGKSVDKPKPAPDKGKSATTAELKCVDKAGKKIKCETTAKKN
jgi:hypothetical protein